MLYNDLVDQVFGVAPGTWSLYQCSQCLSAYLDPRPTLDSISLAYHNYYTHDLPQDPAPVSSLSPVRQFRRALVNGYCNWRYGTRLEPASTLGVLAAWMLPSQRRYLDSRFRFLAKPRFGARLLDVGCGNGAFLELAQASGWDAQGIDIDTEVVSNAQLRGLNVQRGTIDSLERGGASFDAITMHHVLEHVHDPLAYLASAYALLRPQGRLYIETPNIGSYGHRVYKRHWRGLEPPRHLVLLSRQALRQALTKTGFHTQRWIFLPEACNFTFSASEALQRGDDPKKNPSAGVQPKIWAAQLLEKLRPDLVEFATVVCTK